MRPNQEEVIVHVIYDGQNHQLKTYPNEYRNLMQLIADRLYTEDFGECLGMGKCGTCQVEIIKHGQLPSGYDRNENATLLKHITGTRNTRLSCQLLIDEKMDGLVVKVLL